VKSAVFGQSVKVPTFSGSALCHVVCHLMCDAVIGRVIQPVCLHLTRLGNLETCFREISYFVSSYSPCCVQDKLISTKSVRTLRRLFIPCISEGGGQLE
jgi:hypothetical protein